MHDRGVSKGLIDGNTVGSTVPEAVLDKSAMDEIRALREILALREISVMNP